MMQSRSLTFSEWADQKAPAVFILPAILIILLLAIFPLVISLYLSLSRFKFVKGGFSLKYIGWLNYKKLLLGSQQFHFLGSFGDISPVEVIFLLFVTSVLVYWMYRFFRSGRLSILGFVGRLVLAFGLLAFIWLVLLVINQKGMPGTLVVTTFYVFFGVAVQFLIGLILAMLCAQQIAGRNFFRLVFFFPLMVTPVGIGQDIGQINNFECFDQPN